MPISTKPEPSVNTLLSERIYQARLSKGFSQPQLAQRLGVKPKTIKNWETERSTPRANRLHQVAGVLDVPLLWLLAGAETPPEVQAPNLNETSEIESKLERAEHLINELSMLMVDLRANTRRVQQEFDLES